MMLTLAVQAVRVLAIWLAGKAVGVDLSPRPVLRDGAAALPRHAGAVHDQRARRARGVLRQLPDAARRQRGPAFATGFLFFVVTISLSLPGAAILAWESLRPARPARPSRMAERDRLAVVVVTYNALPDLEHCLESVAGRETVVVDHGSTDGTTDLVRDRFPEVRLVRAGEPRARRGLEPGHRARRRAPFVLILNADAWAVGDGVGQLLAFAESRAGRRRRRAEAAQPGRLAAALGAGLPDAVAPAHRVPLPAQAGAPLERSSTPSTRAGSTTTACSRPSSSWAR